MFAAFNGNGGPVRDRTEDPRIMSPPLLPAELRGRGAGRRIRTDDLLITNQSLFRLSYTDIFYFTISPGAAPRHRYTPTWNYRSAGTSPSAIFLRLA